METNQPIIVYKENTSIKALNIAYLALVIALVALCLSGWMLYSNKYSEKNIPQNMEQKVDKFFEKQDQELDKIFNDKEEQ